MDYKKVSTDKIPVEFKITYPEGRNYFYPKTNLCEDLNEDLRNKISEILRERREELVTKIEELDTMIRTLEKYLHRKSSI